MSHNAVRNVQAALILISALVAWAVVPHEILRPLALALFAFAVGGVFGARAYLRRLHGVVAFLESNRRSFEPSTLSALLTDLERKVLRLGAPQDAGHAIGAIRDRLPVITQAGLSLGIVGIGSGLIVIMTYAD